MPTSRAEVEKMARLVFDLSPFSAWRRSSGRNPARYVAISLGRSAYALSALTGVVEKNDLGFRIVADDVG